MEKAMTPMMQQWEDCKRKAKEAVLLFRLGDFYEAFHEDAKLISKELDLTLTKRQEIPMAGVPFHIADTYIQRLVAKGYLVAIAEQMEDPKDVKGIVKRDIVKVVSPATIINSSYIPEKSHNFFASITQIQNTFGLAFLDISTGDLSVTEIDNPKELFDEIARQMPSEILIQEKCHLEYKSFFDELKQQFPCSFIIKEKWFFDHKTAADFLSKHFHVKSLDGFGLQEMLPAISASGALLCYLQTELSSDLSHITSIAHLSLSSFLAIDRATVKHLELLKPLHSEEGQTLLSLLDHTQTAMGGRLLKSWIMHPLISVSKIKERQAAIEDFFSKPELTLLLRKQLSGIRDLDRLIMKIETGYASPKDFLALRISLEHVSAIQNTGSISLPSADISPLITLLEKALVDEPPFKLSDGNIFRKGYNQELDELMDLKENSQEYLIRYQNELRETLGVKTLRVNFNKAFGFFIEVSRGQTDKIPEFFERRQTLVNTERYISPELKEFEHKILSAEEKIKSLEYTLFQQLRKKVVLEARAIKKLSKAIAKLDCLVSLAHVSRRNRYVKPFIDESDFISIEEGRHPVIEHALKTFDFIPNDTTLDKEQRLILITGPNMAGKSTYIRQVALIVIMAQMGCFIPAKKAHIGIVDKVFSRIGASDDLSRGHSTFMVEMTETANILNNATDRSLVILDEIGRGTSTYDGISIAWAVAEHLLTEKCPKTLFATHYFELTELPKTQVQAANYHVAVKEAADEVLFLRKIVKGVSDKSYGIHVAKLAGIPKKVVEKALQKLISLEPTSKNTSSQLFLFAEEKPSKFDNLGKELKDVDLNRLSPMEALKLLFEWQRTYGI